MAKQCEGQFWRQPRHQLRWQLSGPLWQQKLDAGLCCAGRIFGAGHYRPVAGTGRQHQRTSTLRTCSAKHPPAPAAGRKSFAHTGRNDSRHQQVQQQRDGQPAFSDSGPAHNRQRQLRKRPCRRAAMVAHTPGRCAATPADQWFGALAHSAHQRFVARRHVAGHVEITRHAGIRFLHARGRDRWHPAPQPRAPAR